MEKSKVIKFDIEVEGSKYPCIVTMGAMLDFHERHGKELHEATTGKELLDVVYFAASAGAARAKKPLPFTIDEFPHMLSPEEGAAVFTAYTKAVIEAAPAGDESTDEESKKKGSE